MTKFYFNKTLVYTCEKFITKEEISRGVDVYVQRNYK